MYRKIQLTLLLGKIVTSILYVKLWLLDWHKFRCYGRKVCRAYDSLLSFFLGLLKTNVPHFRGLSVNSLLGCRYVMENIFESIRDVEMERRCT